ncbi:hypothetical protein Kfla_1645 [Kribbella flavida DSM 17836]|uniref:3-hydroxyacyl-CoA dehydrogenase n=1 Tax=Kribbella flavida (strain DSM 17836 / JCM 10339 / NBRC 14399) TaxID=479435 RepID=D2PMJ6_KRIFD|nr:Rv3235 family protein [Kribbella flavida]ADB30740.1 hypothetical protein Kfla_1645 [Kribbella flavida DSM 17836]
MTTRRALAAVHPTSSNSPEPSAAGTHLVGPESVTTQPEANMPTSPAADADTATHPEADKATHMGLAARPHSTAASTGTGSTAAGSGARTHPRTGTTYPLAGAGKGRGQGGRARRQEVPTQGALALRYDVAEELVIPARPRLRLVHGGPALPDARAWSTRLVQAIVEVLAGDRAISQLIRWTDSVVFTDLNRRVRLLGLTTTAGKRGAKDRSCVRSIHVSRPTDDVVEVAAHVRAGDRSRAVALRLETHRGRWVCTALELG